MGPFPQGEPLDGFRTQARMVAEAWKRTTPTLPGSAREPGPYQTRRGLIGPLPVCLPRDYAEFNLLPDVRSAALDLFSSEAITWHDGVAAGPSNHLLDSQVQCVNALAPGISDSTFVRTAFSALLPIDEVLSIEPGRYLTFEYIGADDYLKERSGLTRTRGSMTTSADAAIRYRTPTGEIEVALLEWKFTEDYRGHELSTPRGVPRTERYRRLWEYESCPLRRDLLPYSDLFVEPFYQLFRQQLLAWQMEAAGELGAKRVRVVHLCPKANAGVHQALSRPSHAAVGTDTLDIWSEICVQPDRFISVDTDIFFDLRSAEYRDRYCLIPGSVQSSARL